MQQTVANLFHAEICKQKQQQKLFKFICVLLLCLIGAHHLQVIVQTRFISLKHL